MTRDFLEHHPLLKSMAGRSHFPVEPNRQIPSSLYNQTVYNQRIDHFNPLDTRTYKQRVTVVDEFYEPGNPVFIFLDERHQWISLASRRSRLSTGHSSLVRTPALRPALLVHN